MRTSRGEEKKTKKLLKRKEKKMNYLLLGVTRGEHLDTHFDSTFN